MPDTSFELSDLKVIIKEQPETSIGVVQPDIKVTVVQDGETKVVLTQPSTTQIITGSFLEFAESSLSSSYSISSSYAATSSVAISASYALNAGDSFPYSGSAVITGSLEATDYVKTEEVKLTAGAVSLTLTGSITSGVFGVSEYVLPYISTLQYAGASIEYLASRPGATRMGMILATWSGSNIVFTDVSTTDIGDTSDISFAFLYFSNEFRLRVNSEGSGSGTWTIQSLFKLFPKL